MPLISDILSVVCARRSICRKHNQKIVFNDPQPDIDYITEEQHCGVLIDLNLLV